MMVDWTRDEQIDAGTVLETSFKVPTGQVIEVPREMLYRLLREAGYNPVDEEAIW